MSPTQPRLADRVSALRPSATVTIAQRARQLAAQGVDVLSFSLGEPDFDPPPHVLAAAERALADSATHHYTPVPGTAALRAAVAEDSARRRGGVRHAPNEVVVSVGAKHSLFNVCMAVCNPGDVVVVPAPCWVSYPDQVELVGGVPRVLPTREADGFRLAPAALAEALGPETRAVVLCTPSNPTGAAYDAAELAALAEVLRARPDVWVVVDEIYGRLVYGGFEQRSLLEVAPDLRDRLVIVDGASKAFAMTGWRIGWMLAPRALAEACEKLQGQSTTNPTAVAQAAVVAALEGPQEPVEAMRRVFEGRRALLVEGLRAIPGIRCRMPEGAFYAFPDVTGLVGAVTPAGTRLEDDVAVAAYLLDEARCATVPGTAFHAPGFLRISYAASEASLREGLTRIAAAVARLR